MVTRVNETGQMAAEAIAELFKDNADSDSNKIWSDLVESGWNAITQYEEEGEDPVNLRAIQEIARQVGHYAESTALISTLLGVKWFPEEYGESTQQLVFVTRRNGDKVALDYSEGAVLLTDNGLVSDYSVESIDDFARTSSLAVVSGSDVNGLSGQKLVEARAVLAAIAVGCVDTVIETSVSWSQTREQFGQPIASFQAVRHHLANMHIAREQAWTAAIATGIETERSAEWASLTFKLARLAIELGIQVHGGVGFTSEVGLDRFLNRVIQYESALRSPEND